MSQQLSSTSPDIFVLVLFVAAAWIAAWFITRRPPGDATSRARWLRFSVFGIFWLVLASAFLLREWQRAEQAQQDLKSIDRLQNELEAARARADVVEQQLRDQVEYLERQLANQPQPAPGSPPPMTHARRSTADADAPTRGKESRTTAHQTLIKA